MSLQTRLEALVSAIGADIKSLRAGSFPGAVSATTTVTGTTGVLDGANRVYSDSNPPETFMQTATSTIPATPAAGLVTTTVRSKRVFMKHSDGTETEISGSVQQYAVTLSTSATSYTVTHNIGTRDVMVQIYEATGSYNQVWATVQRTTLNTVTIIFSTAPTAGQYRVVVQGKAD